MYVFLEGQPFHSYFENITLEVKNVFTFNYIQRSVSVSVSITFPNLCTWISSTFFTIMYLMDSLRKSCSVSLGSMLNFFANIFQKNHLFDLLVKLRFLFLRIYTFITYVVAYPFGLLCCGIFF